MRRLGIALPFACTVSTSAVFVVVVVDFVTMVVQGMAGGQESQKGRRKRGRPLVVHNVGDPFLRGRVDAAGGNVGGSVQRFDYERCNAARVNGDNYSRGFNTNTADNNDKLMSVGRSHGGRVGGDSWWWCRRIWGIAAFFYSALSLRLRVARNATTCSTCSYN